MTNDEQREFDVNLLKKHSEQLSEHFDTIQIFATRHMPAELNGTRTVEYGSGNWYARYGQAKLWTVRHDEMERKSAAQDDPAQQDTPA